MSKCEGKLLHFTQGDGEWGFVERWIDRKARLAAERATAAQRESLRRGSIPQDRTVRGIVTCPEARQQGLKRFFTGRRCRRGHIAERLTSNYACIQCHRIEIVAKRKAKAAAR